MKCSTCIMLILVSISVQAFANGESELDADGWLVYSRLDGFRSIDIRTNAEVSLQPGADWEVKARGARQDLEDLDLYVSGRTLIIRRESVFNFIDSSDSVEIVVTVPMLDKIVLSSDGSVRSTDLFECKDLELLLNGSGRMNIEAIADSLEIDSAGSGEIDFRGRADKLFYRSNGSGNTEIEIMVNRTEIMIAGSGRVELSGETDLMLINNAGSGSVYADRLTAQNVEVSIVGSGDVDVTALRRLDVSILGSGSLRYYGDPENTTFSILGSGRIKKN